LSGPYRNEVVIGDGANVLRAECHECLRPARCGDELDPNCFRSVVLDDCVQIATSQAVLGKITGQYYDVEELDCHVGPPGYAVTNRGR
jgi:hypothetical protein